MSVGKNTGLIGPALPIEKSCAVGADLTRFLRLQLRAPMSFAHDAGQMVFGCYEEVADASSPPSIGTLLEGLAASKIGGVLLSPSNLLRSRPTRRAGRWT